jgi:hypothetical protein
MSTTTKRTVIGTTDVQHREDLSGEVGLRRGGGEVWVPIEDLIQIVAERRRLELFQRVKSLTVSELLSDDLRSLARRPVGA